MGSSLNNWDGIQTCLERGFQTFKIKENRKKPKRYHCKRVVEMNLEAINGFQEADSGHIRL